MDHIIDWLEDYCPEIDEVVDKLVELTLKEDELTMDMIELAFYIKFAKQDEIEEKEWNLRYG